MIAQALHTFVVGCDISKRWLDCHWSSSGSFQRLSNTPEGWAVFVGRTGADSVVCMEATGAYWNGFAGACHAAGLSVRVVNPWQVRSFADAGLSRTKTDKVDSRLIAEFCVVMGDRLHVWTPIPEGLARVAALVRLGDGLLRQRVAAGNRAHALGFHDVVVEAIAQGVADRLTAERADLLAQALQLAQADELTAGWHAALVTLPGVADVNALRIMAYSGDFRRFASSRQYAAFTGLTPKLSESGDGAKRSRMSRRGSRALRSVYYWAAVSACRTQSVHGVRYREMVAAGKPKKVAVVALANRLSRAAWSVCTAASRE